MILSNILLSMRKIRVGKVLLSIRQELYFCSC